MYSQFLVLVFSLSLAANAACGSSPQQISTAASLRQYPFQQGLQQGLIKQVIDDNTIRVILTDTGAMTLGQCTDGFGSPLPTLCVSKADDKVALLGEAKREFKLESLEKKESLAAILNKGIFGQYAISETAEFSGSASAVGVTSDAKRKTQRHQVVYEWSKYAVVGLEPGQGSANVPIVSSADFGFAVRMILDVVIRESAATANLNLGPGQLEAALALGIAEVSVRHQVLGMRMAMFPDKSYDIKSYSDLQVALADFHAKAKAASEHWEQSCISGAAIEKECNITPVMLAYYVNGQSVGRNLSERHRLEHKCNSAEAAVNDLAAKKLQSKDARLSDSDWSRYVYAEGRMKECKKELAELAKDGTPATEEGKKEDDNADSSKHIEMRGNSERSGNRTQAAH
jgi:hypothetical protein